jgi:hypothetical protein
MPSSPSVVNRTHERSSYLNYLVVVSFILAAAIACLRPGKVAGATIADDGVATAKVTIDWSKVSGVSQTQVTLQVVVNPPLRRSSTIHDAAWKALQNLHADFVRYAFWYPYPKLGVAELDPPAEGKTYWDFSLMDPLMEDFFKATAGHSTMLTISTIPQWMYKTANRVAYPANPDEPAWNYEQGTELRDTSFKEVADYAGRVAGWYTAGGFVDELGRRHDSQYHYKLDYWEVLNEPEYEHQIDAETYTRLYDQTVGAVRAVSPETKFVGMSLAEPSKNPHFFEYFLNHKNHAEGIPLDMISYHFYAVPQPDEGIEAQQYTFFNRADGFLDVVRYIESVRKRLSPETRTDINETGCITAEDLSQGDAGHVMKQIPDSYWNLCGATYAYLFAGLAHQGIDVLGASQLLGYPGQFPSVSLLDWTTGKPNARYWILQMLHNNFKPGDQLVDARVSAPSVFAEGFVAADGKRKVLLINKRNRGVEISLSGASGAHEVHVDQVTGFSPPASSVLDADRVMLRGYSVMVVNLRP